MQKTIAAVAYGKWLGSKLKQTCPFIFPVAQALWIFILQVLSMNKYDI